MKPGIKVTVTTEQGEVLHTFNSLDWAANETDEAYDILDESNDRQILSEVAQLVKGELVAYRRRLLSHAAGVTK